jgi:hypothetical protein
MSSPSKEAAPAASAGGLPSWIDESTPPLLRGIGTLVVLAAAVVSFAIARLNDPKQSGKTSTPTGLGAAAAAGQVGRIEQLTDQVEDLQADMNEAMVVDDVLENVWFECLGFSGTALIATSFFVEWRVRRAKLAVPAGGAAKDEVEEPPSSAPEKAGP